MKKLLYLWKELLATFWFLPVLIICFAILLSISLVSLDNSITIQKEGWIRFFLVNSAHSARSILSTISGAMIGVAGTVFSITLVALTLASSQFGPRLIKNFMYVRLNQIVLGAYISTYLYCLLVLNAVKEGNDYTFIPSISILVAILAAIINIILLIMFIHQIAISLQADKVISDISGFLSKQVEELFIEKIEDVNEIEDNINISTAISVYQKRISIKSPKSGYIRYIESEALKKIITKHDSLLELYQRPGGHLVKGVDLGSLYTNRNWEQDELESISNQFEIGKTKTSQQDIEFSINQMVEIAARALSPGINDPFTAMACIDNLTAIMSYLAQAKFPSKFQFDEIGNLRIIADTVEFEGVLDAAFNQIRQFSIGSTAVILRLMEALVIISGFTKEESHKKAVIKHAEMVLNIGKQNIKEENDIQDLTERARKILQG